MRRSLVVVSAAALVLAVFAGSSAGRDRPFSTSRLIAMKFIPHKAGFFSLPGTSGGQFSKVQVEAFRCNTAGNPSAYVDISCNTTKYGQNFAPDNEIAIAVDPEDADHLLAGSNDYYYRFNNSTGARQALVPTGFFTSFDGGATWLDGQIPMRSGNGAGDPAPAFDAKHDVALMAQLENVGGQGGPYVSQGDVSVSHSHNGGVTWTEPVTVMMGKGAGIGPANKAVFWDKEWLDGRQQPRLAAHFGARIYVTATKFINGLTAPTIPRPSTSATRTTAVRRGRVRARSPARTRSCTFQSTGTGTACDEDQFSIPEVALGRDRLRPLHQRPERGGVGGRLRPRQPNHAS